MARPEKGDKKSFTDSVLVAGEVYAAYLLEIVLHKPATRRTVDPSVALVDPVSPDVKTSILLFESPIFDEIASLDRRIRDYLRTTAVHQDLPWKRGVYLVSKKSKRRTESRLQEMLDQRTRLVDELLAGYEDLRRVFLHNYPMAGAYFPSKSELEEGFRVEMKLTFWADLVAHLWEDVALRARYLLRREFRTLMHGFARSLGRTASGRRRPVRVSTLEKICHFLAVYDLRKLMADPGLDELVELAQGIFHCEDQASFLQDVRHDDERRARIREQVEDLAARARHLLAESTPGAMDARVSEHVH